MKETIFIFLVRVDPSVENCLLNVEKQLRELPGVLTVQHEQEMVGTNLDIHVQLADSEVAKKLHRKVMQTLMKADGISITQTTTHLTVIF